MHEKSCDSDTIAKGIIKGAIGIFKAVCVVYGYFFLTLLSLLLLSMILGI